MVLSELLISGANIKIEVSLEDLKNFGSHLIAMTKKEMQDKLADSKTDSLLTTDKVCEILSVNKSTLYRYQKRGLIHPKKLGGKNMYKRSEIQKFID